MLINDETSFNDTSESGSSEYEIYSDNSSIHQIIKINIKIHEALMQKFECKSKEMKTKKE